MKESQLDGFVEDRSGSVEALYADLRTLRTSAPLQEAIQNTGAVVMGWNAFTMANDRDFYAGNYEVSAQAGFLWAPVIFHAFLAGAG